MRRNTNRKKPRTKTYRKTYRKTHRRSQKGGKDPITKGIKKDYEFAKIRTIANTEIYQVYLDKCYKYFAKDPTSKYEYVIIKTGENEHIIFNFNTASDDIPMLDELKQKIKSSYSEYKAFIDTHKIQQILDLPCKSNVPFQKPS